MTRMVVLILAVLILTGCAVDPRDEADAYRTKILADQEAADMEQARRYQAQAEQLDQAQAEQLAAVKVAALRVLITWLSWAATVAGCLVVIALAVGLSLGLIRSGLAMGRFAELRTSLVPLAETTRQYPLVVAYVGRGRFTLANPNTGSVMLMDTRRAGDRQQIAAAGAVQLAGVVSREARRSLDAAGIVQAVNPVVIGGENG